MSKKRVVVTGIGCLTAIGCNKNDFWNSLIEGKSGAKTIDFLDTENLPVKFSASVKDFDTEKYFDRKDQKKMDVFMQYGMAMPYCMNTSIFFWSFLSKYFSVSKSLTDAENFTGRFSVSRKSIVFAPDLPSIKEFQKSFLLQPMAVRQPMPVTTTRFLDIIID